MPDRPQTDFLVALFDLHRLVRQYVDKEASRYGTTRAQWAVLSKLSRAEGLKQAELAELLDIQPISLTRLIDRLRDAGLIERRPDPHDRRANRLYLLPAAQPVLESLAERRTEIMRVALGDMPAAEAQRLVALLHTVKDNVRRAIQAPDGAVQAKESLDG
ncbi:MAG: MarR family transcriptional regulator [Xanthobacteraceae bacterium]